MDLLVKHRRFLIGVATVAMLAILIPVSIEELPLALGLMLLEACVIGLIPLALGFIGQLVLRDRKLRDRVLFACAVLVAVALEIAGITGAAGGFLRRVVGMAFFTLLLTWCASLGAALARTIRRRVAQSSYLRLGPNKRINLTREDRA